MTLYMQQMIAHGIYVSSVIYPCFTHTHDDVENILSVADKTFEVLAKAIGNNDIDNHLRCPIRQIGFKRLV